MKNKLILGAALLMAAVTETLACTNFIVGKNASTDGSVIVSYSADSYGMFGELYHYPAGVHAKGTMRDIYEWDTGKYLGQIKDVCDVTSTLLYLFHQHQFPTAPYDRCQFQSPFLTSFCHTFILAIANQLFPCIIGKCAYLFLRCSCFRILHLQ